MTELYVLVPKGAVKDMAGDSFAGILDESAWSFTTSNPKYTVTYDGNSNESGSVPTDSSSYSAGTYVTVLGNTGSLAKTGYTFGGWLLSGTTYQSGNTFQMGSDNVTLTAVWTPNSHIISFEENGGSTVSDLTKEYDSTITTQPVSTKDHYAFEGWYTDINLTPANKVTFPYTVKGDATFYAKWDYKSIYDYF